MRKLRLPRPRLPNLRLLTPDAGGSSSAVRAATPHSKPPGGEVYPLRWPNRGLEALESPSHVTLLSGSRHIRRGLDSGLAQWRENGWQWERYGRMTPVKNGDLWRRLDRLLSIHAIDCGPTGLNKTDDLAAPLPPMVRQRAPAGRSRKLRIDSAHGDNSELKHSHSDTSSQHRTRNPSNKGSSVLWDSLISNLFRILSFVLRAFANGRTAARKSRYRKLNRT